MSIVQQLEKILNRTRALAGRDSEGAASDGRDARSQANASEGTRGTWEEPIALPLLGLNTPTGHQRNLFKALVVGSLVLVLVLGWVLRHTNRSAQQLAATGQALMQSQRLAKSVSQALGGNTQAFADVDNSFGVLVRNVRALNKGEDALNVDPVGKAFKTELDAINPLVERAEHNAGVVMAQQKTLEASQNIQRESKAMLDTAEALVAQESQRGASAQEVAAVSKLVSLAQRMGRYAGDQNAQGMTPEALNQLAKDLNTYKEVTQSLLEGNAPAARDPQTREKLQKVFNSYDNTLAQITMVRVNQKGLVAAREAQATILKDSEPLRRLLEELQSKLSAQAGMGAGQFFLLALAGAFVVLCGVGIARVQLQDSRARQKAAELLQQDARRKEQEAKRVNEANQAAILRLMNELQSVAEGDLTQEATVTEDITGAIADSVNYTVDELRQLVGSVQNTANKVAQTTAEVDSTSTQLLAASTQQLHEIRETGQSVLDMATRINEVSAQAIESASVARQSLQAADSGLKAVQNAIGGMNSIRDQIQDTSKRIKRLGESSQEIGEITELISDITEQTNVLALNAAIQAASAGDAGRGFSVVAEEVQRLAERSADATRQISALVKAIQTDTQDAAAAMERSTQGVVEGARLSDSAGTALTEIDTVSRRLAELIEQISSSTSREAMLANEVAENIQHIFVVTEQTGEGTRTTAQQVRELSQMAQELRQSVARFKIA